jgi:hypothetical protein
LIAAGLQLAHVGIEMITANAVRKRENSTPTE